MRIHQITSGYSAFSGGAERVVRELHTGLRSQDIQSFVLGAIAHKDSAMEDAYSLGFRKYYDWREFHGIYRYVAKNVRPGDILHVHQFPPVFYVALLSRIRNFQCHYICTEHSTSNHRRNAFLGHMLDTFIYSSYEQIVAISEGVEQELLKWRPELKGKTRVIYNGTSLPFKNVLWRGSKARLQILSVGNLRAAKNFDTALKALALLGDLDFEYQIAGEGKEQDKLIKLCQDLGLQLKVRFLGHVEAIPELLAAADIFLMPSRWEGFGIAAVEAMNAGLPLVVSDVPGLREIVKSEPPCALLIDPESSASIADGLKQLLLSPDLRYQLGSRAFIQSQKFAVDQMVENYRKLYAEIL